MNICPKETLTLVIFKAILVFRDFKSGIYKRTELRRHNTQSCLEEKHATLAKWPGTCNSAVVLIKDGKTWNGVKRCKT